MVSQMTPDEYFSKKDEIKKLEEDKKLKFKQEEEERQKVKMIFKPGEKPVIVTLPPIKVIINLSHCPHCGLPVDAHVEVDGEEDNESSKRI